MPTVSLGYRALGGGPFANVTLTHSGGGVYKGTIPAQQADFEYYLVVDSTSLVWPAGAPANTQSVVLAPRLHVA